MNRIYSVKVAVHTYLHIMIKGNDEDSIKLAKELVAGNASVVGGLLDNSSGMDAIS